MSTTLWIIVAVFVVIAIGGGLVQILFSLGDKRMSQEVTNEEGRLHTAPDDPENPSSPNQGRN